MASLWNGNGVVVRTDGTRAGEDLWQQARDAPVKILAPAHDTHDQGLADSIEECLNINGENALLANMDAGGFQITNMASGTTTGMATRVGQVQDGRHVWAGTSGGTANAQTLTVTPAITAYVAGMSFAFIAGATNTSMTVTLNVSSVGAVAALDAAGNLPAVGSIVSGRTYVARHDGTSWLVSAERMVLQAAVSVGTGATVDLTGIIPPGARRITLFLDEVSGDGTDDLLLQLGDSGGVEPTGYEGGFGAITGNDACNLSGSSDGRVIGTSVAANRFVGQVTLTRISTSTHRWMAVWQTMQLDGSLDTAGDVRHGVFVKTLSAALDRLQLLWDGSDEFDAGSVSILVE